VARGIGALRTASSQLDGDAAAVAFDLALSQDLNDLLGAPEGSASVAQLELWPGGAPPDWMARRWDTLKRDLIHAGVGWEIWADWYEHRLAGRTRSEAHELAYVEVPDGLWEQGMSGDPAVVNTWIMRRFDQFADIPEIPRPGPGPRFQASPGGPIDRAPTSDVDEGGNDIRTINQLKPLVQQCVSALRAGLSRNEAPHLLRTVELCEAALNPPKGREEEWGELWGLGVMLQNAASAHERQITHQLLPPMEDTVKAALDSLLALHGPLILATSDGARLSAVAHSFAMSHEEQAELRVAAEELSQQLQSSQAVIMPRAAASIADAAAAIGEGKHPERGSVYGLATIKNVSIILIGGAAAATPAVIGALLGSTLLGAIIGSPLSLLAVETVKKNPAFAALVTQLGAKLETMSDVELRTWLEEQGRRFLPFRSFVISNEEPLRKIATSTSELKWMLRYIDFVVGKER
jgi:hypothetical protein